MTRIIIIFWHVRNLCSGTSGSLQESSEGNMSLQQRNSAPKRAGATQITRILIIEPGPRTQPYSDDDHVDKVLRSLEVGDVEQEIG